MTRLSCSIYNESVLAGGATADTQPQSTEARLQASAVPAVVLALVLTVCQWFRSRNIASRPVVVATSAAGCVIAWASFTNFKVLFARASAAAHC